MRCETALERMLEAAPAELRGDSATKLARHIAGCARCSAVAAALLAETEAVDAAMGAYAVALTGATEAERTAAARIAVDAALTAIRPESGEEETPSSGSRTSDRSRGPRWTRAAWIPLAAAAALVGVLVLGRDSPPFPNTLPALPDLHPADPAVSVNPPAERGAAIMETENPDITIVWLYEREES